MKKILFLAICGLLFAGAVSAQGYYGPRRVRHAQPNKVDDFYKVRIGLTGGANFSNAVDYNSDYTTDGLVGFNAGLTLDIPIAYPLSFAPEVLYSQKGFTQQTSDGNYTQRNNYIDVPLLAKFRLSPVISFVVGPQFSFPISTVQTFDDGFSQITRDSYSTTNDKTILDGVIGVSFDLGSNVELRARYTIDMQQSQENTATTGYDYRNQVWQIGLGFKFR